MNILVVDDEPSILEALRPVLAARGYSVLTAGDGKAALDAIKSNPIDLVLLDLGLPDVDGSELIAPIKRSADASVVILSARHLEADKVRALDEGADDYVDKPFGTDELLARIRVIERRRAMLSGATPTKLVSDDIVFDIERRELTLMGEPVHLSPKEFALFEVLARNSGQVVTQRRLMIAGWGNTTVDNQYLRSYISLLRDKLEIDPSDPELLLTEPGVGYRLAVPLSPAEG
ncbi:response regulator transcription factor [Erythrobacter litoralis]|uniref:Putative two-component system response regulator n=1 Tax=Erythrobacter litoralis (strain HTCC2594) TaxID=314225 RepID=Q2NCJ6_ERYLH|nr:response regulator transcription factor [Erythrobacter litoralis]ABC62595.1 putative two-component system response regulator [Erythrobacter litoralis HTCC2594]